MRTGAGEFVVDQHHFPPDLCRVEAIAERGNSVIICIPSTSDEINKVLIHHSEFEKKNAEIIEFLYKNVDVRYVFVDAGYGDCDRFNIPLREGFVNHAEMAKEYLQKGEISGAEYLQLVSSNLKFHIWGVDDRELHRNHLLIHSTIAESRVAIDEALRYYRSLILKLQSQIYGADLRRVIALFTKFQNKEIKLKEYVPAILEEASQLDLLIENWPALEKDLQILKLESRIDYKAANAEIEWLREAIGQQMKEFFQLFSDDPSVRSKLHKDIMEIVGDDIREIVRRRDFDTIDKALVNAGKDLAAQNAIRSTIIMAKLVVLSGKMPEMIADQQLSSENTLPDWFKGFVEEFVKVSIKLDSYPSKFASGQVSLMEVYDFLVDLASLFEIEDASISNLLSYLAYLHRYHSERSYNLFDQIRSLEEEIRGKLARTDEVRKLEVLENKLNKLTKFVSMKLTSEDANEVFDDYCDSDKDPYFLDEISNLSGAMQQERTLKHRKVLKDATKKVWKYYEYGEERGIRMAENLAKKIKCEKIDRAILMTTGYQLHDIWQYLLKDNFSTVFLLPTLVGSHDQLVPPTITPGGFGDLNESVEAEYSPSTEDEVYSWYSIGFENLPKKKCDSQFCTTEGRLILPRIVCLEGPGENMVFWCDVCKKFRCARCAVKVPVDKERFEQLPYSEPLKMGAISENKYPFTLRCKHCGEFLGIGDHTVIIDVPDTLDAWRTFKKRRS